MHSSILRRAPALAAALFTLAPGLRAQSAAETTLYNFPAGQPGAAGQGDYNVVRGLIEGSAGTFYGTTQGGGTKNFGTIYQITSDGSFSFLYNFGSGDGAFPNCPLLRTSDGSLYGTTYQGGQYNVGTVFRLAVTGALTTLHTFNKTDGRGPTDTLATDAAGNFYGTTVGGGPNDLGTIYQLAPDGTLTTLHFLALAEGTGPQNGVIFGRDGRLYGTTVRGGAFDGSTAGGSVFSLNPDGTGFKVLHIFSGGSDGKVPFGRLIQGKDGGFYGVASLGTSANQGTVYRITADGTFTVLHPFSALGADQTNADGGSPSGALIDGGDGRFYGTAEFGGSGMAGTLYSITPGGGIHNALRLHADRQQRRQRRWR